MTRLAVILPLLLIFVRLDIVYARGSIILVAIINELCWCNYNDKVEMDAQQPSLASAAGSIRDIYSAPSIIIMPHSALAKPSLTGASDTTYGSIIALAQPYRCDDR